METFILEFLDWKRVLTGVRSRNEVYPLEKAAEAYDRMMSGKARFRVVLTTGL